MLAGICQTVLGLKAHLYALSVSLRWVGTRYSDTKGKCDIQVTTVYLRIPQVAILLTIPEALSLDMEDE